MHRPRTGRRPKDQMLLHLVISPPNYRDYIPHSLSCFVQPFIQNNISCLSLLMHLLKTSESLINGKLTNAEFILKEKKLKTWAFSTRT